MKLSRLLIIILTLLLLSSCSADNLPEDTEGDGSVPTVSTPTEGDTGGEDDEDDMNKETENRADGFVMMARVDAVGDVIEVSVIDAPHGNTGVFWVLASPSTEVTCADGKTASTGDITPGDTVKITYSGQVMLSYPPRIAAQKIEIVK